jgi:pyrophosphatase PpaX
MTLEPLSPELQARVASVEVVLFDLDGTLVDTVELIMASARHATEVVLGEALPDDVLRHNIGIPLKAQMAEYAPDHVSELLAAYRAHNDRVHDDLIREFPGTREALEVLRAAGYRMGIVTSKSRPVAQRGLDFFGLGGYFETVIGYEDTLIHKPLAEPILECARRMHVAPQRCIYVGDSPHDIACGNAAGTLTAAALWGPFPERVLEPGPTFALESLAELGGLLEIPVGQPARSRKNVNPVSLLGDTRGGVV